MSWLRPSYRQRIIDRMLALVRTLPSVDHADYDVPFDVGKPRAGYVWDADETYEVGSMNAHFFNTLEIAVAVSFQFDLYGDNTLRRKGNAILAEMISLFMKDPSVGELAFECKPTSSQIQDVVDEDGRMGVVVLVLSVQYYLPIENQYSQVA